MSAAVTSQRNLPSKIDRVALDKIIQRAAELQTGERDVGDNLSPDDVLALGKEVGIPSRYLQQAMLEHQATVEVHDDRTLAGRLLGPAEVQAQRVVQGDVDDVLASLQVWMDRNELMVVQRQQSGWTSWEPLRGMQAAIRRGTASLDTTKPKFMLARSELVVATATQLESGYTHVTLSATLKATRRGYLITGGVWMGFGAVGTGVMAVLGIAAPLAAIPVAAALLIGGVTMPMYRPIATRVQLGLERALDYLERGGVKPAHELQQRPPGLLDVLASEVKRVISAGADHTRKLPGQRPSSKEKKS